MALSLEHLWSCARNFASTPTKPTIYSKAKDRRHNIKVQRAERLRTKGKLSVTSRGSIHISRVSTREHPETHEPPTWFPRTKTRATHLKETKPKSSLLQQRKQVPLTKSILLIELVKLDLNAVTEHRASVVIFAGQVKRLNN